MKMVNRLGLVFGIIILLFGGANLLTVKRMDTLVDLTDKLYQHPFTVSIRVLSANGNIIAIQRSMKDVALAKNESQVQAAVHAINQAEKKVYEDFILIDERFLGNKKLIDTALQAFKEWKSIRDEVIALMRSGETAKAVETTPFPNTTPHLKVTVSIGVADDANAIKIDDLIKEADKALYLSKQNGRNQVQM